MKIICKTAMGHDIDFEDKKSNIYRRDVEKIKRVLRIRSNNPLYWFYPIWYLSPSGFYERKLINRMHQFTKELINNRIKQFRNLDQSEIEEMKNQYSKGQVKRKLAFLGKSSKYCKNVKHCFN